MIGVLPFSLLLLKWIDSYQLIYAVIKTFHFADLVVCPLWCYYKWISCMAVSMLIADFPLCCLQGSLLKNRWALVSPKRGRSRFEDRKVKEIDGIYVYLCSWQDILLVIFKGQYLHFLLQCVVLELERDAVLQHHYTDWINDCDWILLWNVTKHYVHSWVIICKGLHWEILTEINYFFHDICGIWPNQ